MFTRSRMITFGLLGLGLAAAACNEPPAPFRTVDRSPRADRNAPFDPPNTYPGWAYDQPEYMRPPNEPAPEQRVRPGEPLHFFSNDKIVMIRQPGDYDPEEIPRVAIWWSDTNGFHWKKAGYFGRGQSYFPFEVKKDGDYGIRFVGPGQEPAQRVLARPKRVYHVDTVLPEVEVSITPEQTWYDPGELVTITWRASDAHPVEQPVRIGMLMDFTADDQDFIELQRDLADAGSISYRIPPEAVDHEITFRVEARDRAGNLGLAFSYPLQVVAPCPETVAIDDPPEPNADEVQTVAADDGQTQAPAALELEQNTAAANLESEADESDRRDTDAEAIVQVEDAVVSEPAEEVQIESVAIAEDLSEVEDTEPAASDDVKTASVSAPVEEASVEAARDNAPETRQADDVIAVSTDVDSEEDTSLDSEDAAAPPKASEPEVAPAIAAVQAKPIADEPGAAQPTDTASPPIYTAAVAPTAEEAETDEHASAVVVGPPAPVPNDTAEEETHPGASESNRVELDAPRAVPFATAITRVADSAARLIWHGAKPIIFPSSGAEEEQRNPGGLFEVAPEQLAVAGEQTRVADAASSPQRPDDSSTAAAETAPASTDLEPADTEPEFPKAAPPLWAGGLPVAPQPETPVDRPPTAAWTEGSPASVDLTHGSGLLVPMPATVEAAEPRTSWLTAHPWRILGDVWSSPIQTVWAIPRSRLNFAWNRHSEGRFLADNASLRTIAAPASDVRFLAGGSASSETP